MITETNSTVDKRSRWRQCRPFCPLCRPNKGENANRKARHGAKKPKSKCKRRGGGE